MEETTLKKWNNIIQANLSILWIQETLNPNNQNKLVKDLLEDFKNRNESILPLNIGTLIMASYILFLYPRENELNSINFDKLDVSKFTIIEGNSQSNENRKAYLVRRIRNSLAHARFSINENNQLEFDDTNQNGGNKFKAQIMITDFGDFINDFMFELKNQIFQK